MRDAVRVGGAAASSTVPPAEKLGLPGAPPRRGEPAVVELAGMRRGLAPPEERGEPAAFGEDLDESLPLPLPSGKASSAAALPKCTKIQRKRENSAGKHAGKRGRTGRGGCRRAGGLWGRAGRCGRGRMRSERPSITESQHTRAGKPRAE